MADEESPEESEKKIDSLSHPEVMALFGEKNWGTLWKIHSLYIYIILSQAAQAHVSRKPTMNSWTRHALCDSVLSYGKNRWKFEHVIMNSMGNEIWSIYNDKYFEIWIFYT